MLKPQPYITAAGGDRSLGSGSSAVSQSLFDRPRQQFELRQLRRQRSADTAQLRAVEGVQGRPRHGCGGRLRADRVHVAAGPTEARLESGATAAARRGPARRAVEPVWSGVPTGRRRTGRGRVRHVGRTQQQDMHLRRLRCATAPDLPVVLLRGIFQDTKR